MSSASVFVSVSVMVVLLALRYSTVALLPDGVGVTVRVETAFSTDAV